MKLRALWAVALAVLPAAARAAPPLLIARSAHFKIYSNDDEASLRGFAQDLERYDGVLRRLTGAKDAEILPLTVYVMADQSAVGGGSNVVGYYAPAAAGAFAVVPRKMRGLSLASLPRVVLFHEYAHHFMLQHFPALYSPWFLEGSAGFYSTIEFDGATVAVGKPEPLRIGNLMAPWRISLDHLLTHGDRTLDEDETSALYARGWLLVHYLTLSKQRGGQIDRYIKARSAGQTEEKAFQSTFGMSISAIDRELKAYFRAHQLPFATLDAPAAMPVAIRPATAAEGMVAKYMPDLRGVQESQSGLSARVTTRTERTAVDMMSDRHAGAVRKAARDFPDDPEAQELAAESELAAGNFDAARSLAATAVRLQPGNARAHLVLAAVILSGADADDAKTVSAARREIALANRAAPDDPLPLIAYYRSFADHRQVPPALAVRALERAYQLAPQDDQLRMMLATEEITAKRYGVAADLLRSVAFAPHPGPRRDAAQKLLNALPGTNVGPSDHGAPPPAGTRDTPADRPPE